MRTVLGFLLGAAAVAMVTTERGRRFAAELADEMEGAAKERIRELKTGGEEYAGRPEKEGGEHDAHA